MFLDRKPLVFLWRPCHRAFVDGLIWPFVLRVKGVFFVEAAEQLQAIRSDLGGVRREVQNEGRVAHHELATQAEALRHELNGQLQSLRTEQNAYRMEQNAHMDALKHFVASQVQSACMSQASAVRELSQQLQFVGVRVEALAAIAGGSENRLQHLEAILTQIRTGMLKVEGSVEMLQNNPQGQAEWQAVERLLLCSLSEPARPSFDALPEQLTSGRLALKSGPVE